MKKSIFILDICIFGLSITALLIAFFKNLSNVNFLIGAGLISLMGVVEAYDTALHNRLETYNHSDYEFVLYCRMLLNTRKSNDMHDHNL